jgi:hypothetical protein
VNHKLCFRSLFLDGFENIENVGHGKSFGTFANKLIVGSNMNDGSSSTFTLFKFYYSYILL